MRTVKIREISAEDLRDAGRAEELVALTNSGAICAVVTPVSQGWVLQQVAAHAATLFPLIRRVNEEFADTTVPFVTLEDALAEPPLPPRRRIERMAIRELSAARVAEARGPVALTDNNQLLGMVVPVPKGWVEDLVEKNLPAFMEKLVEANFPSLLKGAPGEEVSRD